MTMNNTNDSKHDIAQRICWARQHAGLSQGQTAKLMKMHRPTISEIEAGRRKVSAEELMQFSNIFGVDISWLAGEENDQPNDQIALAARELKKLKPDDLKKVLDFLGTLRHSAKAGE